MSTKRITASNLDGSTVYIGDDGKVHAVGGGSDIAIVATPLTTIPTATGNVDNLNSIVTDANGDKWFINGEGDAVLIEAKTASSTVKITGASGECLPEITGFDATRYDGTWLDFNNEIATTQHVEAIDATTLDMVSSGSWNKGTFLNEKLTVPISLELTYAGVSNSHLGFIPLTKFANGVTTNDGHTAVGVGVQHNNNYGVYARGYWSAGPWTGSETSTFKITIEEVGGEHIAKLFVDGVERESTTISTDVTEQYYFRVGYNDTINISEFISPSFIKPARNSLTLSISDPDFEDGDYELIDSSGNVIHTFNTLETEFEFSGTEGGLESYKVKKVATGEITDAVVSYTHALCPLEPSVEVGGGTGSSDCCELICDYSVEDITAKLLGTYVEPVVPPTEPEPLPSSYVAETTGTWELHQGSGVVPNEAREMMAGDKQFTIQQGFTSDDNGAYPKIDIQLGAFNDGMDNVIGADDYPLAAITVYQATQDGTGRVKGTVVGTYTELLEFVQGDYLTLTPNLDDMTLANNTDYIIEVIFASLDASIYNTYTTPMYSSSTSDITFGVNGLVGKGVILVDGLAMIKHTTSTINTGGLFGGASALGDI